MFKFSQKPQSLFDVIKDGLSLFSETMKSVWHWSCLVSLLASTPNINRILNNPDMTTPPSLDDVLFTIFLTFITAYFIIFIFHRMYTLATQSTSSISISFQIAKQKWLPVFFATLLFSIAVTLGLMALVVTGIFLAVLLIFYLPFILFEDLPAIESMKQSCLFTWGYWWQTFLALLVPALVACIMLIFLYAKTLAGDNTNYLGFILSKVIIVAIFTPLIYAMILVQFNNIKLSRDQKGLFKKG